MKKKIRRRFILLATLSVFIILLTVIGLSNLIINIDTNREMDSIANVIIKHNGRMPLSEREKNIESENEDLTVEIRYAIRYFSAYTDLNGNVKNINNEHVVSVDDNQITNLSQRLVRVGRERGKIRIGNNRYYYRVKKNADGYLVVFVDGTSRYSFANGVGVYTTIVALLSVIFFAIVIVMLSNIVIKPFEENVENQRQFITNAGHELKTPLAVISANAEVLEMTNGKNEWTSSILNQVNRLSGLVTDLIMLSKLTEGSHVDVTKFNYSKVITNVCESFKSIALNEKRDYDYNIDDDIFIEGNEKMLEELANILLDNAFKYCDEGGKVQLNLTKKKGTKNLKLSVSNTYKQGKDINYNKFFDRFYREDQSHNSKKAGYGIGLSMAETVVKAHKGKISVKYKDDSIYFDVTL